MNGLRLAELVRQAWDAFDGAIARANGHVVKPSMPILYFGDSAAYAASPLRIVTVGLNPSLHEFPSDNPWRRFPGGEDRARYRASLDAYFRTEPYSWFDSFEPILQGMGASYYGRTESTALHTDICSPVATAPTWGKLDGTRKAAVGDGFVLWGELIEALEPEVVLVSVAANYLARLAPDHPDAWPTVYAVERTNPYIVRMREVAFGGHSAFVVFGRAAQKPFGTVANRDKHAIGAAVRRAIDAR